MQSALIRLRSRGCGRGLFWQQMYFVWLRILVPEASVDVTKAIGHTCQIVTNCWVSVCKLVRSMLPC